MCVSECDKGMKEGGVPVCVCVIKRGRRVGTKALTTPRRHPVIYTIDLGTKRYIKDQYDDMNVIAI